MRNYVLKQTDCPDICYLYQKSYGEDSLIWKESVVSGLNDYPIYMLHLAFILFTLVINNSFLHLTTI
jgi:hypothetical protein